MDTGFNPKKKNDQAHGHDRAKGIRVVCSLAHGLPTVAAPVDIIRTKNKRNKEVAQSRLPGTKMKRQQMAVVKRANMTKTVSERLLRVLRTKGSRILLKSKTVYSLYPTRAMMGSSMYWCVKMR
jgi:hypothetical protein